MLIGLPSLLGPEMLFALRSMGHGDEIAIVDGNYPAQEHARRLVRADGHGLIAVLEGILAVLPLDEGDAAGTAPILRAGEGNRVHDRGDIHHAIDAACARLRPGVPILPLGGAALYPRIRAAHTIVATSEAALYANVILRKGVLWPEASP